MSIEIRVEADEFVCDFGVIEHGDPRPDREQVHHLMLASITYVNRLIAGGPEVHHGAVHSVTTAGDKVFACVDYAGRRWTWELFEARFDDEDDFYVGRWPD